MKKKLAALAFAGASLAMFAGASPAGALHCTGSEGTAPGYSYFGTDHVQEADHNEGILHTPDPAVEGTHGASGCRSADATANTSPADRAPGQNK